MVESQTMKKLNLSAPVDETVDLFTALIKLMAISLTHHITNKVMVRYRKNSIVNLQLDKPSDYALLAHALCYHTLFSRIENL